MTSELVLRSEYDPRRRPEDGETESDESNGGKTSEDMDFPDGEEEDDEEDDAA
jgi:hypothetical protein